MSLVNLCLTLHPPSNIITSNKSFADWGEIFGDQVMATAILDRLLHHSTVISIKGDSYRLREKRKAGMLEKEEKKGGIR
jgi:DNA replication protein DnaC